MGIVRDDEIAFIRCPWPCVKFIWPCVIHKEVLCVYLLFGFRSKG